MHDYCLLSFLLTPEHRQKQFFFNIYEDECICFISVHRLSVHLLVSESLFPLGVLETYFILILCRLLALNRIM